jgi:hypothetical protein
MDELAAGAAGVEWTRVRKCAFIETPRKTDDLGRLVKDGFVLNSAEFVQWTE